MSHLIDTNIISEVRKGKGCDPRVAAWWTDVTEGDLWLSSLVLGEIRNGVELARHKDPHKAKELEGWLDDVVTQFGDHVLPVDVIVAEEWGRMNAIRSIPVIDGLQAATAKVNDLIFVTRNTADVAGLDVEVLNPFET